MRCFVFHPCPACRVRRRELWDGRIGRVPGSGDSVTSCTESIESFNCTHMSNDLPTRRNAVPIFAYCLGRRSHLGSTHHYAVPRIAQAGPHGSWPLPCSALADHESRSGGSASCKYRNHLFNVLPFNTLWNFSGVECICPLLGKQKHAFADYKIVLYLFWSAHTPTCRPSQIKYCREEGIKTVRSTYILDFPFLPSSIGFYPPFHSSLGAYAHDLRDRIAVSSNMRPKCPPPTAHSS